MRFSGQRRVSREAHTDNSNFHSIVFLLAGCSSLREGPLVRRWVRLRLLFLCQHFEKVVLGAAGALRRVLCFVPTKLTATVSHLSGSNATRRFAPPRPSALARETKKWRMGWDSNPRDGCPPAGFQDRCLQPLGHPSLPIFAFTAGSSGAPANPPGSFFKSRQTPLEGSRLCAPNPCK